MPHLNMSQLAERVGGKLRVLTVIEAHKALPHRVHCYKDYLKRSSPLEKYSSRNEKAPC
jgi:hypothetical protein